MGMGLGEWLRRWLRRDLTPKPIKRAKRIITGADTFAWIGTYPYFPPREFLNEFLMQGTDYATQERWMNEWPPFALTAEEYRAVLAWWTIDHPGTVETALGKKCWSDWSYEVTHLWETEEPITLAPRAEPTAAPDRDGE